MITCCDVKEHWFLFESTLILRSFIENKQTFLIAYKTVFQNEIM